MSNDSNKAVSLHISLILLASSLVVSAAEMKTVDDFRAAAAKANAVIDDSRLGANTGNG